MPHLSEIDLQKPSTTGRLSNNDILFGPQVPAIDRLKIISADDYEAVVNEWGNGFLVPLGKYVLVKRCSGAGDMGRDIIAVVSNETKEWDNYQCKHYDHPLAPGDVWIEIGKLLYYTFKEEYTVPRAYYFVAPQGIGPSLNLLLDKPTDLKSELYSVWDKKCKSAIVKNTAIEITDDFRKHIDSIDFSIFHGYEPQQFIEEHKSTTYHATRFGGGLKKRRQEAAKPPATPGSDELVYTHQLFEAYSDHKKQEIRDQNALKPFDDLNEHFTRQRESFYTADSLRQFSRDNLPEEVDYFEELKSEVYTGVIDVHGLPYQDGYERLLKTVIQAKAIQIGGNPLVDYINMKDREGICHHLANDKKLIWVKK